MHETSVFVTSLEMQFKTPSLFQHMFLHHKMWLIYSLKQYKPQVVTFAVSRLGLTS